MKPKKIKVMNSQNRSISPGGRTSLPSLNLKNVSNQGSQGNLLTTPKAFSKRSNMKANGSQKKMIVTSLNQPDYMPQGRYNQVNLQIETSNLQSTNL